MHRISLIVIAAGAAVALAACNKSSGDESPNSGANLASVRIVNASSSNASVNAANGSSSLASNLAFQNMGAATTCATVPAGSRSISFTTPGGTSLATTTSTFAAGQNYTVVLYDSAGMSRAITFPDVVTPPASGHMGVRFINATATAGDIYATAPGATVSGTPAAANVAALSGTFAPTWTTVPSANTSFSMYNAGANVGASTPVGTYNLSAVPTNGVSTVIFTPAATTGGPTAFSVNTCS